MNLIPAEQWADLWLKQIPRDPKTFRLLPRPNDPPTLDHFIRQIQANALRYAASELRFLNDQHDWAPSLRLDYQANQLDPQPPTP